MRKILALFVSIIIGVSSAHAWGLLDEALLGNLLLFEVVNQKGTVRIPSYTRQKIKKVRKHDLDGRVQAEKSVYGAIEDKALAREFKQDAQNALNRWFTATREAIVKANRAEEFQDLLAVFPQKIELYDSSYKDRSSSLLLLDYSPCEEGRGGTTGHYLHTDTSNLIQLTVPYPDGRCYSYSRTNDPKEIILHEVGHAFGLRDQYGRFGWYEEQPIVFSSFISRSASSMGAQYEGIKPDDVDGFINAVDFVMAYKYGVVSDRVKNGWKSFDDATVSYSYMMPYHPTNPQQDEQARAQHQALWQQLFALKGDFEKVGQYQKNVQREIARLQGQVKGTLVNGEKRREELTESELENMMLLAQVNYWETIEQEVIGALADVSASFKNVNSWGKMKDKLSALINKYNIPSLQIDPARLNKTQTKDSVSNQVICAACEKPIDNMQDAVALLTKTRQGKREFFVHEDCQSSMTHNPKKKYLHKPNEQESFIYLTYEQCAADLKAKRAKVDVDEQLQNQFAGLDVTATPANLKVTNRPAFQSQGGISLQDGQTVLMNGNTPVRAVVPTVPVAGTVPPVQARQNLSMGTPVAASLTATPAAASLPVTHSTATVTNVSAQPITPTAVSTGTARGAVRANLPRRPAVGEVLPDEHIVCEICGQEIEAGKTYYKRTSSKAVHRHSQCAYKYFTKKHAVDDAALNTYEKAYWFGLTPANVTAAKGLLRDLDLTVADLRRYRSAEEHERQNAQRLAEEARAQDQARKDAQDLLHADCSSYVVVTEGDVARFEEEHASMLRSLRRKEMRRDPQRTAKEKRFEQQYAQLKENQAKTTHCKKLENDAAFKGVTGAVATPTPVSKTEFLRRVAAFQQNAVANQRDGNGIINGFYEMADAYFAAREEQPYFTSMGWYLHLSRVLASGKQYGTIADYMTRVLQGKEGNAGALEGHYSSVQIPRMVQQLKSDKRAFPQYRPFIAQLNQTRQKIGKVTADEAVLQGRIRADRLDFAQQAQVQEIVKSLIPLADDLIKVQDTPLFTHVVQGLKTEPIYTKNSKLLNVSVFLEKYGRFASNQNEGTQLAELGKRMVAVQ